MKTAAICLSLLMLTNRKANAQTDAGIMPAILEKNGRHTLMVDGRPFFMLGGQAHNSSGWPAMLPQVWTAIETLHANTLEIPVYWEQIEATEGKFDFSGIDTLLLQAREHNIRLVLLWFATWKNGSNHYMPEWMKRNAAKYPNITGRKGQPIDSPSPNTAATQIADIRAFTAVMTHLRQADPRHTVIMVQVENEPGAWDSVRDFGPLAQKLFEGPVPAALMTPAVLQSLHVPVVAAGSWQTVFGERADEYFHAWSVASFIGKVAAAGKAVNPLPLYVNAALRDPLTNPPATNYESGGPTDNVLAIWKLAAPAIDLLAPDIYLSGSDRVLKVLELYDRPDNPLFVPEAGLIPDNAKYCYTVLARGGIGFSPFGIDANVVGSTKSETPDHLAPFADEYAALAPMTADLAKWAFEGKIRAVVEHEDHAAQTIDLGAWQAIITFGASRGGTTQQNLAPSGKAMIIIQDEDSFILTGTGCRISFRPLGKNSGRAWQYGKVEEGSYRNGAFHPVRILNGDETDWGGPQFGNTPILLQATLISR